MYKQIFVGLALLVAVSYAQTTGWRDCGTTQATLHELRVTNCTQAPCLFVRGQTYIIEVDATALESSTSLRFEMSASILGVPLILLSGNACENLTAGTCPTVVGAHFTFRVAYSVPTTLPEISSVVTSQVWNDQNVRGICLNVDVAIRA